MHPATHTPPVTVLGELPAGLLFIAFVVCAGLLAVGLS